MSFLERLFGSKKKETISSHTGALSYHFEKYTDFGQIVSLFEFVLHPDKLIAFQAGKARKIRTMLCCGTGERKA